MALDPTRRARILQAATSLFSAYGYRRTSMDLLAREADVAKPTLYAYFSDKETVFVAVVDDVLTRILTDVASAASADGSLESRLVAVLDAKFGRLFELVHSSPHAGDLLSSSESEAHDLVARADSAFRGHLSRLVSRAARSGQIDLARMGVTQRGFVECLLQAGHGADAVASSPQDHHRLLRTQVHLLLGGVITA